MYFVLSFVLALVATLPGIAQRGDGGAFVTVLGRDTVAIESFELGAARLDGDILLRAPRTVRYHYAMTLRADGSVARSEVEFIPLTDNLPRRKTTITFTADSARVDFDSAGAVRTVRHAVPRGTTPELMSGFNSDYGLYISLGMYESILAHSGASDSSVVPVIGAISGEPGRKILVRRSPTVVDVDYFKILWTHFAVNSARQIQSADATETTEKTRSVRIGAVNIDSAAKEFVRRDRSGKSFGVSSPPDSVRTHIGGTTIAIDYNSPRKRAREILGTTVPYDRVWRTGADAATVLTVNRALTIGGYVLPAGKYTLWTVPSKGGAELVINSQHGQWGTDYDPATDLVHLPLRTAKAAAPQENFTIGITGSGSDGELTLQWDDFIWSIPVSAH